MTKDEILETFKDINHVYNNCSMYDTLKRMLDELTEKEPCVDCISRQAVFNVIDKWIKDENLECIIATELNRLSITIDDLPKTCMLPKGNWIKTARERIDRCPVWECSLCGDEVSSWLPEEFNYCPYCGADMRGGDNG